MQKKKIEKNYFSSHKLPKQQSTRFWSRGILGVKQHLNVVWDVVFLLLFEHPNPNSIVKDVVSYLS
jgi:hypothetical protein